MSRPSVTLGQIFNTLEEERLWGSDWLERVSAEADLRPSPPWYVRAMVGYGAWLASLLLISAIVGMSLATTGGGYVVLGLIFISVSILIRRTLKSDFTRQAALATSMAGQGMLAGGIAFAGEMEGFDSALLSVIVTNAVLLGAYPDKTHRYLSVLFIVGSVVGLIYYHEAQVILPLLGPLLALGVVIFMRDEASYVSRGLDEIMVPVTAGMLMSALGCLLLSTLYIIPEIAEEFAFYPRPWISTLLFGALLLHVQREIWAEMFGNPSGGAALAAYGMTTVVILAALPAPGLILALLVMALGLVHRNRLCAGTGVAYLAVFTGTYFYGIDLTMLTKSVTLVATGLAILLARGLLISYVDRSTGGASA
jgi:hypothetical protein